MPKDYVPQTSSFNLPIAPSWKAQDQLNAYESWVYAGINAIAHEIASLDLHLYKRVFRKGTVEYEELYEHEALSLLNEVNPYSNQYIHLYETGIYIMLLGESFWAVMRDASGRPVSLWQLRPDRVTIIPSEQRVIDKYMYRVGSSEIAFDKEDVIPFRLPNPSVPYRGRSPVQAGAMAIDTDKFSADWNRNFFFNSAIPNLIFTTEQNLTKEQLDRLVKSWQTNFQGKENAHKVAFLTAGFSPVEIGQKMKDMDFIEQRRAMRDEILGVLKVPKTVIGLTEDVNRANAEATTMAFRQTTIQPLAKMLVSYLNEFYVKMWADEDIFFDFEDVAGEDTEEKLRIYESGLKYGWLTINEVRERENLDGVEGGDSIYLPFGMSALGEPTEAPEESDEGGEEKPKDEKMVFSDCIKLDVKKTEKKLEKKFNVPIPHKRLSELRKENIEKEIDRDLVKLVQLAMKLKVEKNDDKKQIFKEGYWKAMIAKTDTQEESMVEKLRKLWGDQEREVLGKLENAKGMKRISKKKAETVLFDELYWEDEFKKEFADFMRTMVEERALEIMAMVGGHGFDLTTQSVLDFLNKKGLEFCKSVNQTTRDLILDQLAEGYKLGEDTATLSKRVKSVYDEASDSRAKMVARTEVLRANNFATIESYKQSGVVKKKEWLTAFDERTCPECEALDGKQVGLEVTFKSSLGAVQEPPLHPQCRCTTIPVMEEKGNTKYERKITPDTLNKMIEKKIELLSKLTNDIEQTKKDIEKSQEEAKTLVDKTMAEAEIQKANILDEVRKQAELEKENTLKDLKDLRDKVRRIIKSGQ